MTGVTFDGLDLGQAYGLILTGVEMGLPQVKTNYIDIPEADGALDLTEALSGAVHYGNREMRLTYETTEKRSGKNWAQLLSGLSAALHGKRKTIVFDDDPEWAYRGRCTIDAFESSRVHQIITLVCTCEPYKVGMADDQQRSL